MDYELFMHYRVHAVILVVESGFIQFTGPAADINVPLSSRPSDQILLVTDMHLLHCSFIAIRSVQVPVDIGMHRRAQHCLSTLSSVTVLIRDYRETGNVLLHTAR